MYQETNGSTNGLMPSENNEMRQDLNKFQSSVSNIYNMESAQFKKFSEFFNSKSDDQQFIKINLVRKLMSMCIQNKNIVHATEQDVEHALNVIKTYDSKLDFEEFVAFMTLFFASKHNLAKRIECFLKSRNFKKNCFLTSEQAYEKVEFLFRFYNVIHNNENMELIHRLFKFDNDVKFDNFISHIYPFLKSRMFVKW